MWVTYFKHRNVYEYTRVSKGREGAKIKSEKLREHQYREGYVRSLEGKGIEWDRDNNVEHMWSR